MGVHCSESGVDSASLLLSKVAVERDDKGRRNFFFEDHLHIHL